MQSNPSHPQVESNTVSESRARLMEELNKSDEDRWRERAENAARARKQRSGVRALMSTMAQGTSFQDIRICVKGMVEHDLLDPFTATIDPWPFEEHLIAYLICVHQGPALSFPCLSQHAKH